MSATATEPRPDESTLDIESHVKYIQSLDTKKDELDYWLTEHLRLNGVYWGLNALHLMGHPDALPRQETIDFILSCQHESGGFGAAPGHDAHMLSTVSAVQVLVMVDALDELDTRGKGDGRTQVGKCKKYGLIIFFLALLICLLSYRRFAKSRNRQLLWGRMGRTGYAFHVRCPDCSLFTQNDGYHRCR